MSQLVYFLLNFDVLCCQLLSLFKFCPGGSQLTLESNNLMGCLLDNHRVVRIKLVKGGLALVSVRWQLLLKGRSACAGRLEPTCGYLLWLELLRR